MSLMPLHPCWQDKPTIDALEMLVDHLKAERDALTQQVASMQAQVDALDGIINDAHELLLAHGINPCEKVGEQADICSPSIGIKTLLKQLARLEARVKWWDKGVEKGYVTFMAIHDQKGYVQWLAAEPKEQG